MSISVTHINLTDVQKLCDNADLSKDHPLRYLFCQMAESMIAQEQATNELMQAMNMIRKSMVVSVEAQKVLNDKMKKIEKRYDNTGMTSFEKPGG